MLHRDAQRQTAPIPGNIQTRPQGQSGFSSIFEVVIFHFVRSIWCAKVPGICFSIVATRCKIFVYAPFVEATSGDCDLSEESGIHQKLLSKDSSTACDLRIAGRFCLWATNSGVDKYWKKREINKLMKNTVHLASGMFQSLAQGEKEMR